MTAKMKMTLVLIALFVLIAVALVAINGATLGTLAGWNPQPLGHCVGSYCTL